MDSWYTRQEAAEKLGVSTNTIYHYSKQGKIKKIPDPHRLHREVRYEKAEIDQLAAEKEKQPKGMSAIDVAKKLKLSLPLVYNYIKEGIIEAEEVPLGDERTSYVISEEALAKAKKELQPYLKRRIRRNEYYNSQYDIALFQHFRSSSVSTARVTKNDKHQWGFYLPITQKWVPYNEGIESYGLKPEYDIHQETIKANGYAYFTFSRDEDIFLPFVDYIYAVWGIENTLLREEENNVIISLKAGEKPFINLLFQLEHILPFLKEGTIDVEEDMLIVRSAYRKTNLELPISMLDKIKYLADKEKITSSEWIERALVQSLNENN